MAEDVMLTKIQAFEKEYVLLADPFAQADALNAFCWEFIESIKYTELCYTKAVLCENILKTIDYPKGRADNLCQFSYYGWATANHHNSIKYGNEAVTTYKSIGDKEGEATALTIMSYGKMSMGNYDEAFKGTHEAIRLFSKYPASIGKGWAYYCLGILYFETRDYDAAIKAFEQTVSVMGEIDFRYGVARGFTFLGTIFISQGKYEAARDYISRSIPLYKETGHDIGLSRALNDMGVLCRKLGQYKESEKYLLDSYELRKAFSHKQGMTTTAHELGELMVAQKNAGRAIEWLSIALALAKETNTKTKEFQIHKTIAEAYKLKGDFANAYTNLEQFVMVQSATIGLESAQRLKQIQTRMATEQAEKEAEIERVKNAELKEANDIIATKNKEIVDSINYAKRLQDAILPPLALIKQHLPDSFVLYKPKDIVAGDFYWMEHIPATEFYSRRAGENDKTMAHKGEGLKGPLVLIAAADCTGHGVPGALVSVVCSNALNRTVKEFKITEPGKILDKVRELVLETFEKSESNVQDGMDVSLCAINSEACEVQWSGAYNSLWYVQNGEMMEVAADKQPIGKNDKPLPFNTHSLNLQKGDTLYLFTDGYADQFGGPKGKKFKYKQLQQLIMDNCKLTMKEQENKLEQTLEEWKGNLEQVDDVLIIGIRV